MCFIFVYYILVFIFSLFLVTSRSLSVSVCCYLCSLLTEYSTMLFLVSLLFRSSFFFSYQYNDHNFFSSALALSHSYGFFFRYLLVFCFWFYCLSLQCVVGVFYLVSFPFGFLTLFLCCFYHCICIFFFLFNHPSFSVIYTGSQRDSLPFHRYRSP